MGGILDPARCRGTHGLPQAVTKGSQTLAHRSPIHVKLSFLDLICVRNLLVWFGYMNHYESIIISIAAMGSHDQAKTPCSDHAFWSFCDLQAAPIAPIR